MSASQIASVIEPALIALDHGAGGGMSHELITETIAACLGDVYVGAMEDSAILQINSSAIAFTTDSFVVDPPFFGNGDIGKIAVAGTVNDLAVVGARPVYLTLSLIIEEGFEISALEQIIMSVRTTAIEAGVKIAAGDTKVVRKGEADRIFLNTAGIGVMDRDIRPGSRALERTDQVIVTGFLGDHSIHLLSMREGLGFESRILSDCAVLNGVISDLLDGLGSDVHAMRDITRGGLGTVLNEFAAASDCRVSISEEFLPIRHETAMAADMLGVDVMYLANEGNLCVVVAEESVEAALEILHQHPRTEQARVIGSIGEGRGVAMTSVDGGQQVVELLYGAQLPRLC